MRKENIINRFKASRHGGVWRTALTAAIFLLGIFLGWLLFHDSKPATTATKEGQNKVVYTCSMDPQVRSDKPGKCPICGMDLIPLDQSAGDSTATDDDQETVTMSDEAMALANIETTTVGTGAANKEIHLFGKIEPDERLEQTQAAYVSGRVERLSISAVGDHVVKGQTLAVVYSPELYSTAQELVAALAFPEGAQRKALIDAAVEKLRLLNITDEQINEIRHTKKASPYVSLKANTSGTVVEKNIEQGDYIKQGQPMLRIANLSTVWATFQAYENDLPFLRVGQTIRFTSEALPGRIFIGRVSFIDPVLDGKSRTAGVRVVMANKGGIFKPEMVVTGSAKVSMGSHGDDIVVPRSAVLWTGRRSVVWVKDDSGDMPAFELRQVTLGPTLPDGYVITDGLAEGEEIVTNGAFAVDATAQLQGKRSMMEQ